MKKILSLFRKKTWLDHENDAIARAKAKHQEHEPIARSMSIRKADQLAQALGIKTATDRLKEKTARA